MLEYIYFVKCPGCEDEPFDFFNEAKDFALSLLSKKPIITQIEVNRNDFGECTDSCDLGTVWSWEEMMKTDDEPAKCVFTKDDLKCTDCDAEFDALDNSVDFNVRKPVPVDMSIDDLVEAMEENEDDVECKGCGELFDKSECIYDKDYRGWLCWPCQQAVVGHGGDLNIGEAPLDEAVNTKDKVEFNYDGLKVTLYGKKRAEDDWDEAEETVSHTLVKSRIEVATDIWENFITEEDAKDVPGGLEQLEDDREWEKFLETHWDSLFDKYYDKLLDYYREDAIKEYEETHSLDESMDPRDLVELEYPRLTVTLYGPQRDVDDWDEVEHTTSHVFSISKAEVANAIWENWITDEDVVDVEGGLLTLEDDKAWELFLDTHFDTLFDKYNKQILEYFKEEAAEDLRERSQEEYDLERWANSNKPVSYLEELEESADYRARLADCPECGFKESFDHETGICINCGFNI